MIESKPCPICGGKVNIYSGSDAFSSPFLKIYCPQCHISMRMYVNVLESDKHNKECIIQMWNTRTSDWHTGTPTEEGEYLCWVVFSKLICKDPEGSWKCMYKDGKWYDNQYEGKLLMIEDLGAKIIAWQKIEPYKGENNG